MSLVARIGLAWARGAAARPRTVLAAGVVALAIGGALAARCAAAPCETGDPAPPSVVVSGPAFQPRWGDLSALVNDPRTDLIVQGCVTYASQEAVSYGVAPIGPDYPQGTRFTLRLSDIIAARQSRPTSPITIGIQGGVRDGVAHIVEGYPLLQVGQGYILFLHRLPDGSYIPVGPPGYLVVRGGRVEPLVPDQPAVEALRGMKVDQARRQIAAERR